ncbi:unnamed protein product [Arctogadus glacialis]
MGRFRFERAYKRRRRETGWLFTSGPAADQHQTHRGRATGLDARFRAPGVGLGPCGIKEDEGNRTGALGFSVRVECGAPEVALLNDGSRKYVDDRPCDQELPDDGTSPSQHPSEERKKKEQRFIQEPAASEASSTVPRVSVGEGVSSPELRDDPWGLLGLLQGVPGSSG